MTTATLPSQSVQTVPKPILWTCAEFHRFGDLGIFEGRGAMLIDGVIFEEGLMNPPHAITLELVEDTLRAIIGPEWRIRSQSASRSGIRLRGDRGHSTRQVGTPNHRGLGGRGRRHVTRFRHERETLALRPAGIREYWVVDINCRQLLVYRDPHAGDFATQQAFGPADTISPLVMPAATIRVVDLLM